MTSQYNPRVELEVGTPTKKRFVGETMDFPEVLKLLAGLDESTKIKVDSNWLEVRVTHYGEQSPKFVEEFIKKEFQPTREEYFEAVYQKISQEGEREIHHIDLNKGSAFSPDFRRHPPSYRATLEYFLEKQE